MNRVIAGYAGSPHAGSALARAVEQARRHRARTHVLTAAGHCARHACCPAVIVPAPAAGTGAPPSSPEIPD